MHENHPPSAGRPIIRLVRPLDEPSGAGEPGPGGRWRVRGSRAEDMQCWLDVQNQVLAQRSAPRPWDRRMWERELVCRPWWSPDRLLVAHAPGNPTMLGCVAVELDASAAWARLHWLAVRPELRRQGIATRLINEAEQMARAASCRELHAETLRAWDDALRFYLAQGFR